MMSYIREKALRRAVWRARVIVTAEGNLEGIIEGNRFGSIDTLAECGHIFGKQIPQMHMLPHILVSSSHRQYNIYAFPITNIKTTYSWSDWNALLRDKRQIDHNLKISNLRSQHYFLSFAFSSYYPLQGKLNFLRKSMNEIYKLNRWNKFPTGLYSALCIL